MAITIFFNTKLELVTRKGDHWEILMETKPEHWDLYQVPVSKTCFDKMGRLAVSAEFLKLKKEG